VFLDRDGTLIRDAGYLNRASQVKLLKGAAEAVLLLRRAGFKLFVVSNQSGVARGYFPESSVKAANRKIQKLLKRDGVRIDAYFYCPHHPKGKIAKYRRVCDCRKPGVGMIRQAARKFPLDLKLSYIVGDKLDDLHLARKARLAGGLLVRTGKGMKEAKKLKASPIPKTAVVSDILGAAKWILNRNS